MFIGLYQSQRRWSLKAFDFVSRVPLRILWDVGAASVAELKTCLLLLVWPVVDLSFPRYQMRFFPRPRLSVALGRLNTLKLNDIKCSPAPALL